MTNRKAASFKHPQDKALTVRVLVGSICVLILQSCGGSNTVATECYQLQEAINTQQPSFTGAVNKSSETAQAQARKDLAAALNAVELSDAELQERRERIVSLNQQLHSLGLQAAEVMTDNGYLSGDAADQYETVTAQKLTVYEQLSTERSSLQIHCSLQ